MKNPKKAFQYPVSQSGRALYYIFIFKNPNGFSRLVFYFINIKTYFFHQLLNVFFFFFFCWKPRQWPTPPLMPLPPFWKTKATTRIQKNHIRTQLFFSVVYRFTTDVVLQNSLLKQELESHGKKYWNDNFIPEPWYNGQIRLHH